MTIEFLWVGVEVVIMFNIVALSALVLVLLERKFLGHLQQRLGPMDVGPHGLFQTVADALKLLLKEDSIPASADSLLFKIAPFFVIVPAFLVFVPLPFTSAFVISNLELGLFYLVAAPAVASVGFFLAGWSSGNKYALLGAVRYAAVLVSYGLPMVLGIVGVAMVTNTLNLIAIVEQQRFWPLVLAQFPAFLLFIIGGLAESNRSPFDISIAESEIVGGPFVEYSGMRWAIFFLAEYATVFSTAALTTILFLGGWHGPILPPIAWFMIKTFSVVIVIYWLRGAMPRLRIDQLMQFSWYFLIPFGFLNIVVTATAILLGAQDNGSPLFVVGSLVTTAVGLSLLTWQFRLRRQHVRPRPV